MQFLFTSTECHAAELAARRRLGVASLRDAALLARAAAEGAPRTSGATRVAAVARAAARGLERLAHRIEAQRAAVPRAVQPLARR